MKRTRIRSVSPGKAGRHLERDAIRAQVVEAAGGQCELAGYGSCWHPKGLPLDVHETPRRSALPGAQYRLECCMLLCRHHHDLEDSVPDMAQCLGIRIPRYAFDADPVRAVAEARRLRGLARAHGRPMGEPYWLAPDWEGVDG